MIASPAEFGWHWRMLKLAAFGLSLGVLALLLYAASILNRTATPGFDVENHYRCVLRGTAGLPLQTGDIILSVNRQPIVRPQDWAEIRRQIASSDMVNVSVRRSGKTYQLRASLGDLVAADPVFTPDNLALQVEAAPILTPLRPGDRILNINGRIVQSGRAEEIREQLAYRDGPSTLLVLQAGRLQLVTLTPAEMERLRTNLVEKYAVFVSAVHPSLADRLTVGDQVLSINQQPVFNRTQVLHELHRLGFGATYSLNIRTADDFNWADLTVRLSLWEARHPGTLLGLLFGLVGGLISIFLLVRYPNPPLSILQSLVYFGMASLLLLGWTLTFSPLAGLVGWALPGALALPVVLLVLIAHHPVRLPVIAKPRVLVLAGAALLAAAGAAWFSGAGVIQPEAGGASPGLTALETAVRLAALAVSVGLIAVSLVAFRSQRQPHERTSANILYFGLIAGTILPAAGFATESLFPEARLSTGTALAILAAVLFGLTLLFDYVRKRVFYADIVLKKSIAYTLVSGVILFLYFLLLVWYGDDLQRYLKIGPMWLMILFLLAAAFLIEPLKASIAKLLDRVFYRAHINYRETILETSRQLNYTMDIPTVIDLSLNKISSVAYLKGGYFFLRSGEAEVFECAAARNPEIEDFRSVQIPASWQVVHWLTDKQGPIELFDRLNHRRFLALPPEEIALLRSLEVSVIAPLVSRDRLLGILLLKAKLSGELFSYEDINFLGILCNNAAIALENARAREKEQAFMQTMHHQKRLALIGQMAANIAHEIRNPLVAIKGLGQLVSDSFDGGDPRAQHMKVLNAEVNRLQNVVSELVRFARPMELAKDVMDLNACIQDAVDLYAEESRKRRIHLEFRPGYEAIRLTADFEKVKQVLINLLQNALDATPPDGRVLVESFLDGAADASGAFEAAGIRVTDTGPGIPAELREKVFEPFFSNKESGTGLGLAIARSIVEEHDGTIAVGPAADGAGAAFEVRFPVQEAKGVNPQ